MRVNSWKRDHHEHSSRPVTTPITQTIYSKPAALVSFTRLVVFFPPVCNKHCPTFYKQLLRQLIQDIIGTLATQNSPSHSM